MQYADFERLIYEMAASASDSGRRAFALDTIGRLHAAAEIAIGEEFTEAERFLLGEILTGVESLPPAVLKQKVKDLDESQCRDPIRAIEFNPKVTELVCALESWADYQITNDPVHVGHIAIYMVNAVDYDIAGHTAEYSTDNMLGAPEMVAEHHRQKRLFVAADSANSPRTTG
jgi:hypothetical protein